MIRLTEVYKEYPNGAKALNGLNLEIGDGEFIFMVGPSGSGKSTVIKLLTGEVSATDGRVMVNGFNLNNIAEWQIPYLRRTLGVIFQDFRLIEKKSVYDNMVFAMRAVGASQREIKKRIPYVLKLVGLDGKSSRLPDELSEQPGHHHRRRAHRQSGPKKISGDHDAFKADQRAGHHRAGGDTRAGYGQPL